MKTLKIVYHFWV